MRVVKNEKGFPAILKDQQECVLAEGFASVLEESNSVEFRSDLSHEDPTSAPMKSGPWFSNSAYPISREGAFELKLICLVHVPGFFGSGSENVYSILVSMSGTLTDGERSEVTGI